MICLALWSALFLQHPREPPSEVLAARAAYEALEQQMETYRAEWRVTVDAMEGSAVETVSSEGFVLVAPGERVLSVAREEREDGPDVLVVWQFDGSTNTTAMPDLMLVRNTPGVAPGPDRFHVYLPHQLMCSRHGHTRIPWSKLLIANRSEKIADGKVLLKFDVREGREASFVVNPALGFLIESYDVNLGPAAGRMVGELRWEKNSQGLWYASRIRNRRISADGDKVGATLVVEISNITFGVSLSQFTAESKEHIRHLPGTRVTTDSGSSSTSRVIPGRGAELQRNLMDSVAMVTSIPRFWKNK